MILMIGRDEPAAFRSIDCRTERRLIKRSSIMKQACKPPWFAMIKCQNFAHRLGMLTFERESQASASLMPWFWHSRTSMSMFMYRDMKLGRARHIESLSSDDPKMTGSRLEGRSETSNVGQNGHILVTVRLFISVQFCLHDTELKGAPDWKMIEIR